MKTYYCNICKKTITKGEFRYSMDKYGKALCRYHQQLETQKDSSMSSKPNNKLIHYPTKEHDKQYGQIKQVGHKDSIDNSSNEPDHSVLKHIAVTAKTSIRKKTMALADATKEKLDKRNATEEILRRMYPVKLKQLGREQKVRFANHSFEGMISSLKRNLSYEQVVDFAQRNHIRINDITNSIHNKKALRELKRINTEDTDNDLFLQIKKEIISFDPLMPDYPNELPYQIDLARYLKHSFENTKVEIQKGASRPDIIIDNIAIEIKGPTNINALQTIADKCMRYPSHFQQGFFIVLFNLKQVTRRFYNEWEQNVKNHFPTVEIIRK